MNIRTTSSGKASRAGAAPAFGETYWWQFRHPPSMDPLPHPCHVDTNEFRELVDNLPTLCWIADADGYITWYNRRWHEYCGTTPEQMEGWGWQSVHDPAVLPKVMESWTGSIASGEPFEMVFPLRGADGVFRPFLTRIIPLRNTTGEIRRWIGNNIDISRQATVEQKLRQAQGELQAVNRQLAEREAFMSSVLAASTDCIKVIELDETLSFMSEGGLRVMEISDFNQVKGCPWPDLLQGDGPQLARKAIEAARQGRTSHFEVAANAYLGSDRFWSVSVSPILGLDGKVTRILFVSRDHTELEKTRQQQRLLNGELAHRIGNTLSVVQAIAYQTLGKIADSASMKAFDGRLAALSSSHSLLTGENWSATSMGAVARMALATFDENRFVITGPEVEIGSRAALALSLMLHELATNAVKYGALSVSGGKILLNWTVRLADNEEWLDLNWTERGGPPVAEPTRKGFGSRVIRMGLIGSGGVDIQYGEHGLTVNASAPLYRVQEV